MTRKAHDSVSFIPLLLSTKQLAAALGKSPRTVEDWRAQKRGPKWVKVGGHVRYRTEDVEKWLEGNVVEPADE
jgi:excisionase family DNA binding protein